MLTNVKSCSLRLALSLAILLASFATSASAQQRYAYCRWVGSANFGGDDTAYASDVFPVAPTLKFTPIEYWPDALEVKDLEGLFFHTAVPQTLYGQSLGCWAFATQTKAEADKSAGRVNLIRSGHRVFETHWIYDPRRQGTHTGGTKATEAEALYDAENWSGPFEDNQYKTIHSWDTHDCSTKQVTGVAGSSKPATFYQCTVTFSYSDTASPVAKAAFGKGDTQDAAIAAAKSSANTVLLTGITWGQPLCSSYYTTVKNPYKADYGHSAGTKKENWACEVDFTGTAAVR